MTPTPPEELLYTPDSPLRRPRELLRAIRRDLRASRELARHLLVRDLRARYRQSVLGYLWILLPPIAMAAGFTLARNAAVVNVGTTELPYPAYVLLSMTLWQTFAEALGAPLQAVTEAKPMLARIYLPREALLLAKLGEVLVGLAIKMVLVVATFVIFDLPVTPRALLAPLAILPLIGLGLALGTLLACVGGLYQDVAKGMPFLVLVGLMITPVVYPRPAGEGLGWLVRLNPVTPLLVSVRELATTGVVTDPLGFAAACAFTALTVLVAGLVFRIAMPFVIERMSA